MTNNSKPHNKIINNQLSVKKHERTKNEVAKILERASSLCHNEYPGKYLPITILFNNYPPPPNKLSTCPINSSSVNGKLSTSTFKRSNNL